ncbi:hypothetical protein FE391_08250 [Nonomuraea sp. KC401]|uniref:hypothetical protein n=1 Tax=unclassified Nonomuraea TaxID=2593643 RepID=UPI0010FCEE8C|nr:MULTISPECIES: hypothetical protein [unclassified Nonomuraea]NBE93934.1 hypothetical protein [Nonomuraea sp. K271]TLF80192.1 hypothetical protein FE391_08250 [Nonomuraea sp. KC401]
MVAMTLIGLAGVAGIAFVLLAIVINVLYVRAGLPQPTSGQSLDAITDALAGVGKRINAPSVFAPVAWLFTTLFAAGLLAALWRGDQPGSNAWALAGLAGVLMQNATFMVVESLRFGMVAAARHHRGSVAGLWAFCTVLFGFNQVFLAIAVLGFTAAGVSLAFIPAWHAWLGWVSAALLFVSSMAAPYNADGTNRIAVTGLLGWLGWASWIVAYSIALLSV